MDTVPVDGFAYETDGKKMRDLLLVRFGKNSASLARFQRPHTVVQQQKGWCIPGSDSSSIGSSTIIGASTYSIGIEYMLFRCRQEGNVLKCVVLLLPAKVDELLSRREKKAAGLEQHKKLQREKDLKRKEKKQVSLPAKHSKGKK